MAAIVGLAAAIAVTQAPQPLPLRSTLAGRAAGLGVQILAEVQTALAENKAEAERVSTVEAPATSAAPSAIRPVPKATNKRGYTRFDQ
jgi:hypothetical protein